MPRNTLSDLNNHLFATLERLGDESLDAEQMKMEIEIATTYGYKQAAADMGETLKQIRAQRAINDAHASISNGLICGQVC